MKRYNILAGVFVLCAIQGMFANVPIDYQLEERMSQVKDIRDWCKLMNMENCEEILKNTNSTEGVDETGEKMVVTGFEDSKIAIFDACNPRELTIALPRHPDPDITIWPTCTRAMRCGGCCTSDVFSCEPTQVKETYVKVFDTRLPYVGAHRFQFLGVRTVKIIEHVQCDAQCRTKKHECHKYQTYEARKCRCVCRPERLSLQSSCNEVQIWDDTECDCICPNRNTINCPEPSYFSTTTCKCTLKTSVTGEIDLDKLFEQLDKGLIGPDIRLKNGQGNDLHAENEIDFLTGGETGNFSTNTETDEAEGTEIKEGEKEPTEEGDASENEKQGEETTTTTTTSTTTKTTTTTTKPTTTSIPKTTTDPCANHKCFGVWKPRLLSNGKCQCFPPFG